MIQHNPDRPERAESAPQVDDGRDDMSRGDHVTAADGGRSLHVHRAVPVAATPDHSDDDWWVTEGHEAAHQAYLDRLGHVNALPLPGSPYYDEVGTDTRPCLRPCADGDPQPAMPERMRDCARREIAHPSPARRDDPAEISAQIQAIRDRLHAQALDDAARRGADVTEAETAQDAPDAGHSGRHGDRHGDDVRGWDR